MINLPFILMVVSILLFTYAAVAALILYFNKLGLLSFKVPIPNCEHLKCDENRRTYIRIIVYCIFSRIVIYVIGILGYMLVKNEHIDIFTGFSTLFSRWDAEHYIFLAENWYVNYGDKRNLLVFFPLYPILIKLSYFLTLNYEAAGIMVSNISLISGCIYLYKIARLDFDSETSLRSVKYLLLFPVSFFLGITYSESLFFALTVATLFYWRKRNFAAASILALMTALTRSIGILIVIPLITDSILEYKKGYKNMDIGEKLGRFSTFFSPFIGFFIYLLINFQVSGNAFTFLKYQKEHWSQSLGFFGSTIKMIAMNSLSSQASESASLWLPQLLCIFAALFILSYSVKHLHISYVAYMLGYIFISISPTWLLSAPRYIMCLFPLFILLGYLGRKSSWDFTITMLMSTVLAFCTIAFVNGYYIM